MTKSTIRGRPRLVPQWASTMRYSLVVSYAANKDVHTALHMAGAQATELVNIAVREYLIKHGHPAALPDVQARIAAAGLGMGVELISNVSTQFMGDQTAIQPLPPIEQQQQPVAPVAVAVAAPAPVAVVMAVAPPTQAAVVAPIVNAEPIPQVPTTQTRLPTRTVPESLRNFAREQLEDS